MVPLQRLQKAAPQDREKSIYIFILCRMTKRGICANSGHQADTAMFEAIACTLKTWTSTKRTKWLHPALGQTRARLSWGAQSRQGRALEGAKVQGATRTAEQNPAATVAKRCFRKTTSCAPADELWGQTSMKAMAKCDRTRGNICYSHWHTDNPACKPGRGRLLRQLHPKVLALRLECHLWEIRCLPMLVWCFVNGNLMFKHFLVLLLRTKPCSHQLTRGKEVSQIHLKPTLKPSCWYFFFQGGKYSLRHNLY